MPANTKEYQKTYRAKNRDKRKVVSVSIPADKHQELLSYAQAQKVSLSTLLRETTLAQMSGFQVHGKEVSDELKELRFLISNIANNVNQMAYHSNRLKMVADENAIFAELQKLDEIINNFVDSRLKS